MKGKAVKNYTEADGLYDGFNTQKPSAINEVTVASSVSKILEGKITARGAATMERKVTQYVCACGVADSFSIFGRGFTTVGKCNKCGNEKVIHEG